MARQRPHKDELLQRFTLQERLQHWVLLLSLTVLALTGFALFAHGTWIGRVLLRLEGGMAARGTIHRIFAVVLMLLAIWHLGYALFSARGREQLRALLFRREDAVAFRQLLAYYLGKRRELPEFGRFTPMQKLQYWGAGLGSLLMIATGLVLWFHTKAMAVVPKWFFDITNIVHGYEGLLLFGLLFVWHVYIVHLSPGHLPINRAFWSGKITAGELYREHRLEYRELFGDLPPEGYEE